MKAYHNPTLSGNAEGLSKVGNRPLFDFFDHSPIIPTDTQQSASLTNGGRLVFARTRRPAATCNALAAAWGIGQTEYDHAR